MIYYFKKFFYVIGDKKNNLIFLSFLFLVASTLDALGIGLVGPFMSLVTNQDALNKSGFLRSVYLLSGITSESLFIGSIGILIILVFCIKAFAGILINKSIFRFAFYHQIDMRLKLLNAYLSAPYTFHLTQNSASLIETILESTTRFCLGVMLPILQSLSSLLIIICILALLLKTDLLMTNIILVACGCIFLFFYSLRKRAAEWGKRVAQARVEIIKIINHSLGSIKETRVIGCELYFEDQLRIQAQKYANANISFNLFNVLPRFMIETLLVSVLVGYALISLFLNHQTDTLTSVLSIFAVASFRLMPSITTLVTSMGKLKNTDYVLNEIYASLKTIEEMKFNVLGLRIPDRNENAELFSKAIIRENSINTTTLISDIELVNIEYRYPNSSKPSLKNISLKIRKGESVALIGKSGAGKTTLVDVILGLLIPEEGDIKLDGESIYADLRGWQNKIAYIPQNIFLADATIKQNIAYGIPECDIALDKLEHAIKVAQLSDVVQNSPRGIDTEVGEKGILLSGGQRQRIGIARAIYHERDILVLDEATAALDTETECLISDAINSLMGSKTLIIIAHRLSTVENCNRVYLMENGSIVNSGSYEEVVLNPIH